MAAKTISRRGFAQVEPNHLAGIVEGKILAQLPVNKTTMGNIIENGRFAKYDYATGEVNLTGKGEWMLIYNEEKKYDERLQSHKDFAMVADDFIDGIIVPRLISTEIGDIMTTNAFGMSTGKNSKLTGPVTDYDAAGAPTPDVTGPSLDVADIVSVDAATGYLKKGAVTGVPQWQVVKVYTMADGQPGVKLIRIA